VIGAVHIAQALVRLAAPLGLGAIVVDPRPALATAERFPGVTLMRDWPDEALDLARLDARSAVVALTHDPKLDDPALDRALRSPAFYIASVTAPEIALSILAELVAVRRGARRLPSPA
jgi:xanthine dehydrogenase accessory factor